MILRWSQLLEQLQDHGVTLETTDLEILTETGERMTTQFLVRWVHNQPRYHVVEIENRNNPVPKYMLRRIAIALDLPPDIFITPDEPL